MPVIVDAVIWHWTPTGMRRSRFVGEVPAAQYVLVREVERLLEDADERRRRQERDDQDERHRDTGDP